MSNLRSCFANKRLFSAGTRPSSNVCHKNAGGVLRLTCFSRKAAPFVLHNGFLKEHGKTLHEQIHRLKEPDNLATTHLGAIRDWLLTMFLLKVFLPKYAQTCC